MTDVRDVSRTVRGVVYLPETDSVRVPPPPSVLGSGHPSPRGPVRTSGGAGARDSDGVFLVFRSSVFFFRNKKFGLLTFNRLYCCPFLSGNTISTFI